MPVEMPYKIECFPGRGQLIPFKIYPTGFQAHATPEEHVVWQYLEHTRQRAETAEAAIADLKAIVATNSKPKQR